LCASPSELIRISSTSGTTGRPLYYATTPDDKHTVWRSWHHIYRAAGIGPEDRTLYGFAMGGPYGGLYGAEAFEEMGVQCIPVGSDQSSDRFIQLLCDLKPTVLTCVSNFPMRLVQQLRQQGFDPRGIGLRMLLLGGEPVSPVRAAIEEDWGVEVFEMMGAGETGMIWGECPHRNGMHYLSKDLVLVEFIDPDTLEAVRPAPGLTAELVYTHLRREACPLVRYRTRDLVTVSGMDCECSRRGPRITCVGRTDDMLKVRGMNIFPSAIADLLASFGKPVTDNFRIVLQGGERKFSRPLSLVIGIETSNQSADERARLQEKLSDYLRSNLNVRTEVKLIASSELGDALRGGLGRRDYFVDARAE
jgi:phenylacetate-CoA ligase